MVLDDFHLVQLDQTVSDQIDAPPYSAIGKLRAPIPAEHTVGLSEILVSTHTADRRIMNLFMKAGPCVFDITDRGLDFQGYSISLGSQVVLYVEIIGPVHIVGPADGHIVDINSGYGINAL